VLVVRQDDDGAQRTNVTDESDDTPHGAIDRAMDVGAPWDVVGDDGERPPGSEKKVTE
jgi:hypothetical protein